MTGTVGIFGLGAMGRPIADHVVGAGYTLIGFDPAGTQHRIPAGGLVAASGEQVVDEAEVVLLSLPEGSDTISVSAMIRSREGRSTSTVVDLSTIGPRAAAQASDTLAEVGVAYVDAPVSGGVSGAVAGTIALMFSGPERVLEAHRPLLESFSTVYVVGTQPGQGQAMKLLNNFLSATALAATSEAIAYGEMHGLEIRTMLEVLNASSGRSSATDDKFPRQVVTGAYATGFRTALMAKDVRSYIESAPFTDAPSALGLAVDEMWRNCHDALPDSDCSEMYRFVTGTRD